MEDGQGRAPCVEENRQGQGVSSEHEFDRQECTELEMLYACVHVCVCVHVPEKAEGSGGVDSLELGLFGSSVKIRSTPNHFFGFKIKFLLL